MTGRADITAWRPPVRGLREVFHAHFTGHAYPSHTHDAWTLLIVDDGMVRYGLHRHEHGALRSLVTLLPPDVAHDGRPVLASGFRKRVLYLERELLGDELIGQAVDQPSLRDPLLRLRVHQLHHTLARPGEELEAESRLTLVTQRLRAHLGPGSATPSERRDPGLADRLRDLLGAHPVHLVRAFGREYGMPPHRYLTGRRVDLARRHLLDGRPPGDVAALAGFYDQAHLTRHFKRVLGTTPARYARPAPPGVST